ncbi:MAG: uL15 family ribosomal protein [Candidatus Pacearchaeota archaeon]
MIKTHKRKKSSRIRGARTFGYGFRQKHKGHGNKGGFGMAGAGKRADHRRQLARNMTEDGKYFGKQGFTSKGTVKKKYDKINLIDIKENFFKKTGDKIDLSGYKILGEGEGFKAEIKAKSASVSAIEKMEKAGGKIVVSEKPKKSKEEDENDFEEELEEKKASMKKKEKKKTIEKKVVAKKESEKKMAKK